VAPVDETPVFATVVVAFDKDVLPTLSHVSVVRLFTNILEA